jgi:RNase_H superfamily
MLLSDRRVGVSQADTTTPYAFWADAAQDECHIWQQFVGLVGQYPDAPIYHYGSYEPRALATLAKRYHTDSAHLTTRLVNVNQYIYLWQGLLSSPVERIEGHRAFHRSKVDLTPCLWLTEPRVATSVGGNAGGNVQRPLTDLQCRGLPSLAVVDR